MFNLAKKFVKALLKCLHKFIVIIGLLGLFFTFFVIALYARFFAKRQFDVGLGPQPLINNIYHKKALERFGYTAKTFVLNTYFITTDFDYNFGLKSWPNSIKALAAFTHTVMNYKVLYTYFNGTMLYMKSLPKFLRNIVFKLEPALYKLAGLKLVVMPYGGDVHNLSLCGNLAMKNSIIKDYPQFQKDWRETIQISTGAWTQHADHVISGCDWVWFLYHWDTLLSAHFSIDTQMVKSQMNQPLNKDRTIKIFHAPNHLTIKGSKHFVRAIEELKQEGYNVELVFVQKKPNKEALEIMDQCDIVADQLIIGWYGITAVEGMALSKPVLTYLHSDILDLFEEQEVFGIGEMPIINCSFRNVKSQIRRLLDDPLLIETTGRKSREFAEKYHSLEYIGGIFDKINTGMGIKQS